ncbi:MAG TPA: hypothetical protein IAC31_08910 [Candidatus Faecousia intestinigallinarum]|nr:hypothetical protein [Candidatus Faecousia intestinigallinarum]
MDERNTENPRPVSPRRHQRSKIQEFKETYLPIAIAALALLLIAVFIIGAIGRSIQKNKLISEANQAASESAAALKAQQDQEARSLLEQAAEQAAGFNYLGAVDTIDSFSGNIADYPDLQRSRQEYLSAQESLVLWEDPSQIMNLSFQTLIADTARAFTDEVYGSSYNQNFVTTGEFSKILQQLYDNGYILVSLSDFITTSTGEDGQTIYVEKPLYLPPDKKPVMITQTNVNYNLYMVDGDGDGYPDKDGAGFASRLVLDGSGKVTAEMVDANGSTITGAYDLVPILDEFIAAHPDFSYNGARAILALTGYTGLFGYRTNGNALEKYGEEIYNAQLQGAADIADALRDSGYVLAFYTYDNIAYGSATLSELQDDLALWQEQAEPILGKVDILAFAKESELSSYSGEMFDALMNAGFRYYLGFSFSGFDNLQLDSTYVRQSRLLVTGYNMAENGSMFSGLFDPAAVLDTTRSGF